MGKTTGALEHGEAATKPSFHRQSILKSKINHKSNKNPKIQLASMSTPSTVFVPRFLNLSIASVGT